jgi:hypothetical protein
MGNPQPSPKFVTVAAGVAVVDMDAVHRLNGGGWTHSMCVCLRYSQALVRASRIYKMCVVRETCIEACGTAVWPLGA